MSRSKPRIHHDPWVVRFIFSSPDDPNSERVTGPAGHVRKEHMNEAIVVRYGSAFRGGSCMPARLVHRLGQRKPPPQLCLAMFVTQVAKPEGQAASFLALSQERLHPRAQHRQIVANNTAEARNSDHISVFNA